MKIMILTPRFPFPENGGDVLRINNIARYLKSQGHQLVLVSFYVSYPDVKKAKELYDEIYVIKHSKFESVFYSLLFLIKGMPIQCGYYYSQRFKKLLNRLIQQEHPDRYISHLIRMASYLEETGVREYTTVEMTDALSKTYSLVNKSNGISLKKIIYQIEQRLIAKQEEKVIQTFPKVVLVSEADKEYLEHSFHTTNSLCVHSNGVNLYPVSTEYDINKICFIGNMRTLPNQEAAKYFAKEIFPLIKKEKKNAKFYIIGAQPSHEIIKLAERNSDIIVTGYVEDLHKIVSDSCLAIAPIRIAAGIQNKVLVAMGMAIPVVLTSLISKAIPELKSGENCFIADETAEIVTKCLTLMDNSNLRKQIGQKGYEVVNKYYSWQNKLSGY